MQNWPLPFLAIMVALAIGVGAGAPSLAGPAAQEVTSVDTSEYPTVTISYPLVDEDGQPVSGLTAEDFSVQQNGQTVAIDSVEAAVDTDVGAGVVVVIDISGSMAGAPIEAAKAAAISFVGALSPADLVAVVAFSDSVQLVQPFTGDKAAATSVIQGLTVFGDTALFEAANQSLDFAQQSGLSRQAVVLLSDGANDDPNGGPDPQLVLAHAAELGTPVFAVALGASADATFTQQLADASGGVAYTARTLEELSGLYGAVAERLNSEYIMRYQAPPGVGEQTIVVSAEVDGTPFRAETTVDVLWSATSEEGGPIVGLPGYEPGSTIDGDQLLAPTVTSTAAVTGVTVLIDGVSQRRLIAEPYEYTLEAAGLSVGRHQVAFEASDEQGRAGRYEVIVEVGEASPKLVVAPEPPVSLEAGDQITVDVLSQGRPVESVLLTLDGEEHELSETPYVFTVPDGIEEGPQEVSVAAEIGGQRIAADYQFEAVQSSSSSNLLLYVGVAVATLAVVATYFFVRRRRKRRAQGQDEAYVPGMRDGLEPLVAPGGAVPGGGLRAPKARLRAVDGPLAGRIFFLGNGSGVIGTSLDASVQIELAGWETAPEIVRIWSREDKYMFHQVAPGNVTVSGREAPWAVLESGDEIRIGEHLFIFEIPMASPAERGVPTGEPAPAQL